MYLIERFLGSLKKYLRNHAHPKGSIAEAYIINEPLTFCSMYLRGVKTRFIRQERNWVDDDTNKGEKLFVFDSRSRPIGKMTLIVLENEL